MTSFIPPEKISEIQRSLNIIDIVSDYVTLKQTGRNFLGLCPFHHEKTPSFTVNVEKQIYKCFGCGEGARKAYLSSETRKRGNSVWTLHGYEDYELYRNP